MKNTISVISIFTVLYLLLCCNRMENTPHAETVSLSKLQNENKIKLNKDQLANKKDPICGMPAFKYLKDTAVYNKKIYGFCGTGCKVKFLKSPEEYLKKM